MHRTGDQKDPGIPFPEIASDAEYVRSVRVEPGNVQIQTGYLGNQIRDAPWQLDQLKALSARRSQMSMYSKDRTIVEFTPIRRPSQVVLCADFLLVRTADYVGANPPDGRPPLADLLGDPADDHTWLADKPFDPIDRRAPATDGLLEGRLTCVRLDGITGESLLTTVDMLRDNGYEASIGHIVPLNGIMKIKGAIRFADTSRPFPPRWLEQGAPVTVAVVDTGVEINGRLDGWLRGTEDPSGINTDPLDVFPLGAPDHVLDYAAGHGTFVAGIIAQVSPTTDVKVYRAVDSDGIGSEVNVAMAMVQAAKEGAAIINLSLGTDTIDNRPPLALSTAMDLLSEQYPEILVVAAAGNSGTNVEAWPAAFKGVVAVAALDADLQPAPWSNYGRWIDISTVGQGIVSTFVPGTQPADPVTGQPGDTFPADHPWGVGTGTSFAAPQIAGAVARVLQRGFGSDPQHTISSAREAVEYLKSTGPHQPGFGHTVKVLDGVRP